MNYGITKSKIAKYILAYLFLMIASVSAYSQLPVITTRFANPEYSTSTEQYCVDVEFRSDVANSEIFGMNVRFFYDDYALELIGFSDFQGGYAAVTPNPPLVYTYPVGPAFFGFTGAAEFINGAFQLVNTGAAPIILETDSWTKIFTACFNVDDPDPDVESFCPSLVWDLEQNPNNGGWLTGDDGVVITIMQPDPGTGTEPVTENVEPFNWMYVGSGSSPFGQPVQSVCVPLSEELPVNYVTLSCPQDAIIECHESTNPSERGFATATHNCFKAPTITYSDEIQAGSCDFDYRILRTWTAVTACGTSDECIQIIDVQDTTFPEIIGVPEMVCTGDPILNNIVATDNCSQATLTYTETFIQSPNGNGNNIQRIYFAADKCGNISTDTTIILSRNNCYLLYSMTRVVEDVASYVNSNPIAQIEGSDFQTEVETSIQDLNLWPNPASRILNVSFNSVIGQEVQFSLMNFLGHVVYNDLMKPVTTKHAQSVNVEHLSPGSYLMVMRTGKELHTKIIMITDKN